MSVLAAQRVWCQWSMGERLALFARWQTRQSVEVRAELALLQEQAPDAMKSSSNRLADGRRVIAAMGPLGVVELQAPSHVSDSKVLAHLAWACVLGNAVYLSCDNLSLHSSVEELVDLVKAADPALESLIQIKAPAAEIQPIQRQVSSEPLHIVVAPSAALEPLIKDSLHAGRQVGVVLWVNSALHHEVGLRLPNSQAGNAELPHEQPEAGAILLRECGDVLQQLLLLYQQSNTRVALYSGDWRENELACESAAALGEGVAINTVKEPPIALFEMQARYQRPSLSVVAHVAL